MASMKILLGSAVVLGFYAFFYRTVVRTWGRPFQRFIDRLGVGASHGVRDVQATAKLGAAGVAQAAFAVALVAALGIHPDRLAGPGLRPSTILIGAALGLAELAVASVLCTCVLEVAVLRSGTPLTERRWLAHGRGGWMGQFGATVVTAPAWLALASIGLYVAVEEVVFRGILIELLRPLGGAAAVGIALLLFVAVQAFNMPRLRGALFAMVGAAVIGVVHGLLYWRVPDVVPLIAAHLSFFVGALWLAVRPRPAVWPS
jgi:Type II CAAX prenyl endopeptidase Rce1-like